MHAVLITPKATAEVEPPEIQSFCIELKALNIPEDKLPPISWQYCPVTAALGMPLQAARWHSESGIINQVVLALFVKSDPEDDQFGRNQYHNKTITGPVLLARTDGVKKLEQEHVEVLLAYTNSLAEVMTEFVKGDYEDRVAVAKEIAEERLTERAFDRYFQQYKAMKVAAGTKEWVNVASPVGVKKR